MSKKILLCGIVILLINNIAKAQLGEPNVIPPAPNAAKIQQFGITPTSLYTGSQNLSVPLYAFDFDGQGIVFNLGYNSGGIKVNEEASWVGLGWALNNLGTISRTIVGFNDFNGPTAQAGGYVYDAMEVPATMNHTVENDGGVIWNDPYWNYLIGSPIPVDAEPDKFTYNLLGSSGSFVLSKKWSTNGKIEVVKLKENTDRIEFDEINMSFTVTTSSGFKGVFDVHEYTTVFGGTDPIDRFGGCEVNNIGDPIQHFNEGKRAIATWHLSEIESPNGLKLFVEYLTDNDGFSNHISKSAESFAEMKSISASWNVTGSDYQSCSYRVYEHTYPSRIYSDDIDLEIIFNTATRNDLRKLTEFNNIFAGTRTGNPASIPIYDPLRLTGLTINGTHPLSTFSKTIIFNQSYFGSGNYRSLRLRLDGVSMDDQDYSFEYYNGQGMPEKTTLGMDYWGYYNGKNSNTRLLPPSTSLTPVTVFIPAGEFVPSQSYYYQRDDRKADFSYGIAGLLKKVIYPTGGYTTYEYEGHTYKMEDQEKAVAEGDDYYYADAGPNSANHNSDDISYTGSPWEGGTCAQGALKLTVSVKCNPPYGHCSVAPVDESKIAVEIIDVSTGNAIVGFTTLYFNDLKESGSGSYTEIYETLNLPAGTYRVKTYNVTDGAGNILYYGSATASIPTACNTNNVPAQSSPFINQTAGGARISKIENYDVNDEKTQQRSFDYDEQSTGSQFTSGRLIRPLYNMSIDCYDEENDAPWALGCLYVFNSGDVISGGGSAMGNHVGYSVVKETFEGANSGNIGTKFHYFVNNINQLDPFGISASITFTNNGQKIRESVYGSDNSFKGTSTTTYGAEMTGEVRAMKLFYSNGQLNFGGAYTYDITYNAPIEMIVEEGLGGNQLETRSTYTYNDYLLKDKTTWNSNGDFSTQEYKYPKDINSPGMVIEAMLDRNHQTPIETIKSVNGQVLAAAATRFEINNGNILPAGALVWNEDKGSFVSTDGDSFGGGYEERTFFTKYDARGNVLEFTNESGVKTTMLWGYNSNYPVAQIQNAAYDDVIQLVNQNDLDAPPSQASLLSTLNTLRSHPGLSKALITTMTYDPHVGMLTQTGPDGSTLTYAYDAYDRLEFIKDQDGKILQKIEYAYMVNAVNTGK